MGYLTVNGKKEKIPPFPHHKEHFYQCKKYFEPENMFSYSAINRFCIFRQGIKGIINKCTVPRVVLLDPTNKCNIRCKGCWAEDYSKGDDLSFEELDDLFAQFKKLSIEYIYMSGGEPLLRKDDILKLAKKYNRIFMGIYTNGLLIDEEFADRVAELGNIGLFISIEGSREETDYRRGEGTYDKVLKSMELLKKRNVAFMISACYHAKNYINVTSDEFIDDMRRRGAWMAWYFTYIPVGKNADTSLICAPSQRAYAKERLEAYSKKHDFHFIDFWNSGHISCGCVAGAKGFIHINARGDVEPCAFCHYSDSNIKEKTLVEALRSPFFRKFRSMQPFSDNPLRACPILDVPGALVEAVEEGKAHSTHYADPETAKELTDKTKAAAEAWEPVAETLKQDIDKSKIKIFNTIKKSYKRLLWIQERRRPEDL